MTPPNKCNFSVKKKASLEASIKLVVSIMTYYNFNHDDAESEPVMPDAS